MDSKIKHDRGIVTFVMRTGKTFVRDKMQLATALAIAKKGKEVIETKKRGYGYELCVDDTYFFPMVEAKLRKPKKTEVVDE